MLPRITRNKFSSTYEKSQYYADLFKGYIHLNENTNEPITEYNIMCIDLISSAIREKLNPTIIKLAIIGKLAYKAKDYGTSRNCYQIIYSLQSQRNYFSLCESTLKRAAINKNYYIVIKYNLNKGVVNRCDRLNESLMPSLIEESKLNVYADYLAEKGITLESELEKYAEYDFNSEEFIHYVDLVEKRIERHLNSVSEEKKSELLAGFEKQKLLAQQRNEAKAVNKDIKRADDLKQIKESLSGKVTQIFDNSMLVKTTYMRTGSVAQKLYQRVDSLIANNGIDACLKDRVVVIALHPRNKSFLTANIKYHIAGRKALTNDVVLATMFLEKQDAQYIQGIVDIYKEKYIVDLAYVYRADDYIQGVGASRLEELHRIEEEKNKMRIQAAHSLGLSDDATYEDIKRAKDNKIRIDKARSLGLDDTATWTDINNFIEESRKRELERLYLEEQETAVEIQKNMPALPSINQDIAYLAEISIYQRNMLTVADCFKDIISALNCLCYSYCDVSYLPYIPDSYIIRYYKSLYSFTHKVYVYYRNLYGVAYKLSGRIEEYRAFNNDFKICFDKLRAFYIYFNPTAEVARNLIERCLNYLSAIKSEGFSIQKAFKDSPLLEKYYKECLHSDIKAFVQAIGYENEDLKSLYNIIAKVKRALSKTD